MYKNYLTLVTAGEPRHNVDRRLITVVTEGLAFFASGVVAVPVGLSLFNVPALAKRSSNSSIKPCLANGAGSIPLLVKRSATDAKHFKALSETLMFELAVIIL